MSGNEMQKQNSFSNASMICMDIYKRPKVRHDKRRKKKRKCQERNSKYQMKLPNTLKSGATYETIFKSQFSFHLNKKNMVRLRMQVRFFSTETSLHLPLIH